MIFQNVNKEEKKMDKHKFTPGPWNGDKTFPTSVWASGVWVASTNVDSTRKMEEREANAILIAASPEMYEALSDALRWLNGVKDCYGSEALGESMPVNCISLGEIGAVLDKALGK
jgi:hypothetical protein